MPERYEKLKQLIEQYHQNKKTSKRSDISEEAIRVWLNEMLFIFGWDVRSTTQIIQEKRIKDTQKNKLEEISSTHIKPDYTLVNGNIVKSYLDAKNISVDLFTNREAAFQIRSYGWSAGVPCAFLSNFEQFAIYDCKEPPKKDMPANVGVIQLRVENKRKRKV